MNSIVDTMEATMTAPVTQTQQPLRNSVRDSLNHYFGQLGDTIINNLYEMVLAEVEAPLLELVMQYTKGNQSKAAILLGLSRGTLRKKLKIYSLLD